MNHLTETLNAANISSGNILLKEPTRLIDAMSIEDIIGRPVLKRKLTPPVFGEVTQPDVKYGQLGEILEGLNK